MTEPRLSAEYEAKKDVKNVSDNGSNISSDEEEAIVKSQIADESSHQIKYRSCSWQKTAALLFSEYICLAVLSFPWSFSVLGLVPGIILTLVVAVCVLYTSLVLWRYCMKHPEIRDVCDIGQALFGGSKWAYNATAVFFLLNNTFIQALHVLVGAKLLNTLTNSAACTIAFSAVATVICFVFTLPRTLSELSHLGLFSAVTMGIAVLLAIIFAGVEDHPYRWTPGDDPIVTLWPVKGTTFVAGMSAFMNITYTFVGQITLPSFIAEMKEPKDFPKALWAVSIAEMVVFTLCGALMYHWVGNQYMTAPAFGSLSPLYKKIAFSFAIPTIVFLGALYGSVTARFLFFRIFKDSHHRYSNTTKGWATWVGIIAANWAVAFVIAEVIPFFSDLLSLMCSLFDCWFGFIFWGLAYLTLYPGKARWAGAWRSAQTLLNYFIILVGAFILVGGTYASVQSIVDSYRKSAYGSAFTCVSNAL
ncbi:transmembrane amino acid transporter protein-domain-containing protein [Ganoderma leucocontextum]|nr:transmembrane amino acid transporter protein-domain-containing protein [Ganoderma leucocontextum]KAI1785270.1 transmembrane amino acid transporter protein-domain-containing protein [Ganoderma leucocontextum]